MGIIKVEDRKYKKLRRKKKIWIGKLDEAKDKYGCHSVIQGRHYFGSEPYKMVKQREELFAISISVHHIF